MFLLPGFIGGPLRMSPCLPPFSASKPPLYVTGLFVSALTTNKAATFNIFYSHRWRNYVSLLPTAPTCFICYPVPKPIIGLTRYKQGLFIGYVLFNFALVFLFSWIFLHGSRNLKRWLSMRKANATAKEAK